MPIVARVHHICLKTGFIADNVRGNAEEGLGGRGWNVDNDCSRLQTVDDFLNVCGGHDKVHVAPVLVDTVSKHLLALFVYQINIVQHNDLAFALHYAAGLTEHFQVVSIVLNALLFERVQHQYVFIGVSLSVVRSDNRVDDRGLSNAGLTRNQYVQVVD